MIPKSLAEVAQLTLSRESFDLSLGDFLDQFYSAPGASALAGEPPLLEPLFGAVGGIQDAYLAATAEELCRIYEFPVPAWTAAETRKLHRPFFASKLASLRAVLLLESPPAFRSRNLFVSANALTRA
jgi:hypothetical protein